MTVKASPLHRTDEVKSKAFPLVFPLCMIDKMS